MVWCDGTWSRNISLPDSVCNATDPPMTWRKKGVLLHLDTWAHITEMAHVPLAFTNTHTHTYIYIYKDRIEPYKLRVWERILSKDCGHNFPSKPWAQLSLSGACRPEITWVMQTPIRRFNLHETVSPKVPMRCLVGSWEEVDRSGWQCDQHFTVFTCLCFHVFPLLHRQISNLELRTCWLAVRELNIDCWSWPVSPFLPAIRECCEMLWEYPRSSDGIGPANAKSGLWRRETPDTSA